MHEIPFAGRHAISRPIHYPSRIRLAFVAAAVLACTFVAAPAAAADEAKPSAAAPQRERLTIASEEMTAPWTG
ncbi:MAG: hypothetical protein ABUU24_08175, partial [Variovorax sp.]